MQERQQSSRSSVKEDEEYPCRADQEAAVADAQRQVAANW